MPGNGVDNMMNHELRTINDDVWEEAAAAAVVSVGILDDDILSTVFFGKHSSHVAGSSAQCHSFQIME